MIYNNNSFEKYKQQSIMTASRGELTLMLYNGCIKFINRSILSIDKGDIEGAHESNIRAQLIISEFMQTLNMSYDMSNRLWLIYDYLYRRLVEANIKKDKSILQEVLGFVTELRDTWEQVLEKTKGQNQLCV